MLRVPKAAFGLVREAARHVLRRPVVGIAAACRTASGEWLLVRRGDTGTWGLPGGTLEWGETLRDALARELAEEAGVVDFELERVAGVFSRPDRDPRFHGVTVVVRCRVGSPVRPPENPIEIREVRSFALAAVPRPLALAADDLFDAAQGDGPARLE